MLLKHIFINLCTIITFFYFASPYLWGGQKLRKKNLTFRNILIGILLSGLTLLLLKFPFITNDNISIQIKSVSLLIATVFFSSTTLITICSLNIFMLLFINGYNDIFIADLILQISILCFGLFMILQNWNEKKRIIALIPFAIFIKLSAFYVIDLWTYYPIGEVDEGRLIRTVCYWLILFIPALFVSLHIAYLTRNTESELMKLVGEQDLKS
ncbi:hypothetical protein [Gottfriedia acidiceleris]|uniref:Uncharacterized protein n=1 Tax=Gottfriedia acidiceleris TaxID=371036 RepID=A0ABY4JHM2_9BACI|nr:hypothetical protein [Gottfriedia acidiceleris]UPM52957.1 hypothetical protein MY490_14120 [Gottfriedia acidiceleris]